MLMIYLLIDQIIQHKLHHRICLGCVKIISGRTVNMDANQLKDSSYLEIQNIQFAF
jgi:hypothetical protein